MKRRPSLPLMGLVAVHVVSWMGNDSPRTLQKGCCTTFAAHRQSGLLTPSFIDRSRAQTQQFSPIFSRTLSSLVLRATVRDTASALDALAKSALTREVAPENVFEAIRVLENSRDALAKLGFEAQLSGDWRLIYTTGTKKTEDEIGRVNYVPITAIQRFDMERKFIRNGVYLGPLSLEFEGTLRWIAERRRLEFDFEDLKVCGFSVPLSDGLRSAMGMKSSQPYKKQPAFEFVAVDSKVAAARGAGGGVALWLRNEFVPN